MKHQETHLINLKNDFGIIISVDMSSCYPPDSNGVIIAALGGFSYFAGKITSEAATHKLNYDKSLFENDEFIPVMAQESKSICVHLTKEDEFFIKKTIPKK